MTTCKTGTSDMFDYEENARELGNEMSQVVHTTYGSEDYIHISDFNQPEVTTFEKTLEDMLSYEQKEREDERHRQCEEEDQSHTKKLVSELHSVRDQVCVCVCVRI